ncbi:MAG: hypothetical protein IJI47_06625 [Eubacterium sp.]|nr:hypothetical protein [Eubacterium sp.]
MMIKGINRQILEVTNPESPYFDKILFFVSSDGATAGEEKLHGEAQSIARQIKKPPKNKRTKKEVFLTALYIACGIGAGTVMTFVLSAVLQGVAK